MSMTLLITKHFVCDFMLQTNYQAFNKHILGHPGGILHAFIHIIGTLVVLPYSDNLVILALSEGVAHYFIDYAKMNIGKYYGWGPTTHTQFWVFLGFDQYLHYLCYIIILYFL